MDNRHVRSAIEAKRYRVLAGAELTLPANQQLLLQDVMTGLDRLVADINRITPEGTGAVATTLECVAGRHLVRFVLVPNPQADISKPDTVSIDEHAVRELEKQVMVLAKIAAAAIDEGNSLALTAAETRLYAEEIQKKLADSTNQAIARNTMKRACGNQQVLELACGPSIVGGNLDIPSQYPSRDDVRLVSCQFLYWQGQRQAFITSPSLRVQPRLQRWIRDGKLKITVHLNSREEFLLQCLNMTKREFSMKVNAVEDLTPQRSACFVTEIDDGETIRRETGAWVEAKW